MSKIGVLLGTESEINDFPYKRWKSELNNVSNKNDIDFFDWIVGSSPICTFHNILFDKDFTYKYLKIDNIKRIRSVYCSCFEEYCLLQCDSSDLLYKRISILKRLVAIAKKNNIGQVIVPIISGDKKITQKQIDNIVFAIRLATENLSNKGQKILIETNLNVDDINEIFYKIDNSSVGLSQRISDFSRLGFYNAHKTSKFLKNVTLDTNDEEDLLYGCRYLDKLNYKGDFLVKKNYFFSDNNFYKFKKWVNKINENSNK